MRFQPMLAAFASLALLPIHHSPDSAVDAVPALAYVEPSIAADPGDANTLVAGAMSIMLSTTDAYVSHDGGYDWKEVPLPLGRGSAIGDVQVGSAPDGKIYFTELGSEPDASGKDVSGIHVFVSSNHGDTFEALPFVAHHANHGYDHEQLAIDNSHAEFRGRIYMSVLEDLQQRPILHGCGLLRSSDGGHSFSYPVLAIRGWCFNSRPVILSDGTVVFPFYLEGKRGQAGLPKQTPSRIAKVEVAISKDGGETFTSPHAIGRFFQAGITNYVRWTSTGQTDFDGDPVPQFTAGISPVTHRDVIYGVWSDLRTNVSRLLFTRSTDGGAHWTRPRSILTTADPRDAQYQASLAVNQRGVLGVAYLRCSHATGAVEEMFADSADGGATFSQAVSIESAPAELNSSVNSGYSALSVYMQGHDYVGFLQPERRYPSGGDYVGMAVDRKGTFHPIWTDARTSTDQVWTASVFVGKMPDIRPSTIAASLSKDIHLQFGLATWNAATRTLSAPVRLHNAGTQPLYPPFTVTVLELYNPALPSYFPRKPGPALVNADNGRHGIGATFTYDAKTLGNLGVLASGSDTAARIWKIHLPTRNPWPSIIVGIDGYKGRKP